MKKSTLSYFIPVAALILFYACSKPEVSPTQHVYSSYGDTADVAKLRVNLAFSYQADPTIYYVKVNGVVVSNALQSRQPYPGGGFNTRGQNFPLYLQVPKGNNTVSIVLLKAGTSTDSVVLYTTTVTTPDKETYTLHVTDTLVNSTTNNTKSVLIKNIITNVDTGRQLMRYVNLMPNVPSTDLYLNGVLLKSNCAYLVPTDTFSVRTGVNAPGYANAAPKWEVKAAGGTTTIATYTSATTLSSQFIVTAFAMGYNLAASPRQPFISFTTDKYK